MSFDKFNLNEENAYLVFRGTNTKEGFFARNFNIKDTLSSHVGLAIYTNDDWYIYHVLEVEKTLSDYNIDTLDSFLNKREDEVFYYSFWELSTLNSRKIDKLKFILNQYKSRRIIFDRSFKKDSTKLYCSEFICKVLNTVDSTLYNFEYSKRELKGIYKTYFNKDTLEYYPVDMFQYNDNFEKIYEWSSQ